MQHNHPKKIASEVIHDNALWKYEKDTCAYADGTQGDFYHITGAGAVIVIPVLNDNKLVLIHNYRYLENKISLEFPAGQIEAGETPLEAAKRELKEETGYTGEEFINIGVFEPFNSFVKFPFHVFLVPTLSAQGSQALAADEQIEVLERRADEFDTLVKRGEVWDGKTLAAWAIAHDRLLAEGV